MNYGLRNTNSTARIAWDFFGPIIDYYLFPLPGEQDASGQEDNRSSTDEGRLPKRNSRNKANSGRDFVLSPEREGKGMMNPIRWIIRRFLGADKTDAKAHDIKNKVQVDVLKIRHEMMTAYKIAKAAGRVAP